MARIHLILAIAALLSVGAIAQGNSPVRGRNNSKRNTCAGNRIWNGCNKCTGTNPKICLKCKDKHAVIEDSQRCVCKPGYGLITQDQWVECTRSPTGNANAHGPMKKSKKGPKGCFQCSLCGLAVDEINHVCVPPGSPHIGRRLFAVDEEESWY
jgi:hypothetical protein